MASEFDRLLQGLRPAGPADDEPGPLPEEPADLRERRHPAWSRQISDCEPPIRALQPAVSIERARGMIDKGLMEYEDLEAPVHALIIKASPGTGKTRRGVRSAERMAGRGWRVLYCGPRHDFFQDVLREAEHPDWWYEWLPRQTGQDDHVETCPHAEFVTQWVSRGYRAMDFCAGVCGWDYINNTCLYHLQKNASQRIIFGQHQHLFGGHPLKFHAVIGDECPLAAACHEWFIPGRHIMPPGLDPTNPLAELLHRLRSLAGQDKVFEGPELLEELGGPAEVLAVLETSEIPLDAVGLAPHIHDPYEVENKPYFHFPALTFLLRREAEVAAQGKDYPHRVIVTEKGLILLLRRRVNEEMPAHKVWLDATAEPRLYEAILGRPVEVVEPNVQMQGKLYQVYDRANGKGSFVRGGEKSGELKASVGQLKKQVLQIKGGNRRIGVITHMALTREFEGEVDEVGHFYAERGTNRFEGLDALVVAGTPQPPLFEIDKVARMVFFDRMEPFAKEWSWPAKPYAWADPDESLPLEKRGRAYPAPGFWQDPDMQAILHQFREAEIIQAVHRLRSNIRADAEVWLLANLPIPELPPTMLLAIREVMDAPKGVDCFRWPEMKALADEYWERGMPLGTTDIMQRFETSRKVAVRYWNQLMETEPEGRWEQVAVPTGRRGRPAMKAIPFKAKSLIPGAN